MSMQYFEKNDIVLDYHGKVIRNIPFNVYTQNENVIPEYCIETFHANKRIIDATAEKCPIHTDPASKLTIRCLGRLANHSRIRTETCNMKLVDVKLSLKGIDTDSHVMLIATRKIQPFEELRFDYGDSTAHRLFDYPGETSAN
jgi:hypothetical protein